MYLLIELLPKIGVTVLKFLAKTGFGKVIIALGGVYISPVVLKITSNAMNLINDAKVGIDAQKIIKRISEYEEEIGTLVIEKRLKFKNQIINNEISIIKDKIKKIEEKNKESDYIIKKNE